MTLTDHQPITWARIADACPLLTDVLDTAQRLSRRSPGYCANRTWYGVFKPILLREVGMLAELQCNRIHPVLAADLDKPVEHDPECAASIDAQRWLKSSKAYDVAYDKLYAALPDCQHDGECY